MKKALKVVCLILIAGFVVIQFFRIDKSSLPVVQAETIGSTIAVSPDISQILVRSCNNCHSNATDYPWYSNLQPVGWYLKNHIDDGRRKLNFDIFNTYPAKKKVKKLEEICEQVETKEMPLPSYLWLHGEAVLSDSDARALCEWATQEKGKIVVEPAA